MVAQDGQRLTPAAALSKARADEAAGSYHTRWPLACWGKGVQLPWPAICCWGSHSGCRPEALLSCCLALSSCSFRFLACLQHGHAHTECWPSSCLASPFLRLRRMWQGSQARAVQHMHLPRATSTHLQVCT